LTSEPDRRQPRHEEVADVLRARIESGDLAPGQKLPSEKNLLAEFDISITTLRKVLDTLRGEGLVESRQGAGVTVREFRPVRRPSVQRLASETWLNGKSIWDGDLNDRPWRVEVEVDEGEPPAKVVTAFGTEGTMLRRGRRFYVDDKPVQLATSYLLLSDVAGTRIAEKDTGPGGVYARLAELGLQPVRFREEVRARMPRPDEKEALAVAAGTPVIEILRVAATADGRVVEVNDMLLDGGSYILDYVFSS
jgi:GntR family transcriptional regulator